MTENQSLRGARHFNSEKVLEVAEVLYAEKPVEFIRDVCNLGAIITDYYHVIHVYEGGYKIIFVLVSKKNGQLWIE